MLGFNQLVQSLTVNQIASLFNFIITGLRKPVYYEVPDDFGSDDSMWNDKAHCQWAWDFKYIIKKDYLVHDWGGKGDARQKNWCNKEERAWDQC